MAGTQGDKLLFSTSVLAGHDFSVDDPLGIPSYVAEAQL